MLKNLKTIWLSIGKLVKLILIILSDEFFLFIPIYLVKYFSQFLIKLKKNCFFFNLIILSKLIFSI
jgi:hypothetical protein